MAVSKAVKIAIVKQEVETIEQLIYQATIRCTVAERVKDTELKKQVIASLESLEARLRAFRDLVAEVEAEEEVKPEEVKNEQG